MSTNNSRRKRKQTGLEDDEVATDPIVSAAVLDRELSRAFAARRYSRRTWDVVLRAHFLYLHPTAEFECIAVLVKHGFDVGAEKWLDFPHLRGSMRVALLVAGARRISANEHFYGLFSYLVDSGAKIDVFRMLYDTDAGIDWLHYGVRSFNLADLVRARRFDVLHLVCSLLRRETLLSSSGVILLRFLIGELDEDDGPRNDAEKMLRHLYECGVSFVNLGDDAENTALHICRTAATALFLIELGVPIGVRNKHQMTPLMYSWACKRELSLRLLLIACGDHELATNRAYGHLESPIVAQAMHTSGLTGSALCGCQNFDDLLARAPPMIARYQIEMIRARATNVCLALHALGLSALEMALVVEYTCAPFTNLVRFGAKWALVCAVKHHRTRKQEALLREFPYQYTVRDDNRSLIDR